MLSVRHFSRLVGSKSFRGKQLGSAKGPVASTAQARVHCLIAKRRQHLLQTLEQVAVLHWWENLRQSAHLSQSES
jgi:hypothetical protein